jgi:hypothetical protein
MIDERNTNASVDARVAPQTTSTADDGIVGRSMLPPHGARRSRHAGSLADLE